MEIGGGSGRAFGPDVRCGVGEALAQLQLRWLIGEQRLQVQEAEQDLLGVRGTHERGRYGWLDPSDWMMVPSWVMVGMINSVSCEGMLV